jgi:hypothetical protein
MIAGQLNNHDISIPTITGHTVMEGVSAEWRLAISHLGKTPNRPPNLRHSS